MTDAGVVYHQGALLGSGGYGSVYHATTTTAPARVVALKKSRVSLRVRRPLLHYEACVLQRLQGHPAIPRVVAYGRAPHFEYLAIELLGAPLGDRHPLPLQTVLHVADQMLSALEHVHARGLVHRDVKPHNILRCPHDPARLCLIDFGLARAHLRGPSGQHDPETEGYSIAGTLNWASLNAHHGIDLARRDDLESLAYTLLFLLRGDLPWRRHTEWGGGTHFGKLTQVRRKKTVWPGARLAAGYPAAFGDLLDYARGLAFDAVPDYARLRATFQDVGRDAGLVGAGALDWGTPAPDPARTPAPPPVVAPGQLVFVQVLARLTVEGYTRQAGDASFWHDPALLADRWSTPPRPAVVLGVETAWNGTYHTITVLPLRRGPRMSESDKRKVVPLASVDCAPPFPLDDVHCYAFPRVAAFLADPEQAPVPAHWTLSPAAQTLLRTTLHTPKPGIRVNQRADEFSDPDEYADVAMRKRSAHKVYARFSALAPATLAREDVDWAGARGWFDECVRVGRRRNREDGWAWTVSTGGGVRPRGEGDEEGEGELSDSYFSRDLAEWDRQQERDCELTLLREGEGGGEGGVGLLEGLETITQVVKVRGA